MAQINLSWTQSFDNVGVQDYLIERCTGASCTNFSQIATTSATSYADTTVSADITYRYQIRARDAAGNMSAYSAIAEATATAAAPPVAGPDFHLQPDSDACGAGVWLPEVLYDFDGRPRPNPPSIGAYEGNCPLP